jgi:DNA repair exonuclease SbcCD nuclease subunit
MKFGFITDIHARLDNPSCRSDFYPKSLFEKLDAAGEIWRQEGVDVVILGGDLTHIPSPSLSLVHDLSAILKRWGKRIITVTGSHDIIGYQS